MKSSQSPIRSEEFQTAYPKAVQKMNRLMTRLGNEDERFETQYLKQLIIEEVLVQRLQAHLLELEEENQGKQDKKRYAPESTHQNNSLNLTTGLSKCQEEVRKNHVRFIKLQIMANHYQDQPSA